MILPGQRELRRGPDCPATPPSSDWKVRPARKRSQGEQGALEAVKILSDPDLRPISAHYVIR